VNAELAARIAASTTQDSTLVTVPRLATLAETGPGPTLARYVLATTGSPVRRPVRDIRCAELDPVLHGNSKLLVVSYDFRCGSLSHPDLMLRRYYRYLDLSTLALKVDSIRVDLLLYNPGGPSGVQ
jgi:hypothetical protein